VFDVNGFLSFIAQKIWESLEPWLKAKWEEVKPKLFEFIKEQFAEFFPQILKTITVGMASSAGQLVVREADKVTEAIPGQVDDFVVDTIVDRSRDMLRQFGIEF
jgi:hypothetical protein